MYAPGVKGPIATKAGITPPSRPAAKQSMNDLLKGNTVTRASYHIRSTEGEVMLQQRIFRVEAGVSGKIREQRTNILWSIPIA